MNSISQSDNSAKIPKVSIGMPVYNGERYLHNVLQCLLAQTYTNFELIISDNFSTDSTKAICKEFCNRDARILYHCQSENIGAANNFLFVLNQARGEFFMWASCDDHWDNNWLEVLLSKMDIGTVISFGRVIEVWPDKSVNKVYPVMGFSASKPIRIAKLLLIDASNKAMLIHGLFRRAYFNTENGRIALKYFVSKAMYIELYFVYKIAQDGNIATTDSTCFYKSLGGTSSPQFQHKTSMTHRPASFSTLGVSKLLKKSFDILNPVNLIKYHILYIFVPSSWYIKLLVLVFLPVVLLKHYLSLGLYLVSRITNKVK